jgi:hypothetical protein
MCGVGSLSSRAGWLCSRPGQQYVLAAVLLVCGSAPAFGQAKVSSRYTPQLLAWHSLLYRVVWLENEASTFESRGKSGTYLRALVGRQAGLTAQEEATLKSIASDWRGTDLTILAASKSLIVEGARGPTSPTLQALASQRLQNLTNHVSQAQAAFGPRFRALDIYAHISVTVGNRGAPTSH